jgi:hypothetical protein
VFFFPFAARDRKKKLHREWAVFFFPFVARDRRRKLHRERAVFCFPFAARDRRRKLHLALQNRQTDRHCNFNILDVGFHLPSYSFAIKVVDFSIMKKLCTIGSTKLFLQ